MMESSAGSCNHQYSMYYVKRYIEEVVRFSSQENCLDILQSCFEKDKAKELQSCLSKNNLLEHKGLEYWLNFYVDFVNDQVNDYINIGNHEKRQGVWLTNNIPGGNGTKKIKYINLQHGRVGPFVAGDSSLQLQLRNKDCWFHGTVQQYAYDIQKDGIILQGNYHQDFSHGDGAFYVSDTYRAAVDWALKMCEFVRAMNPVAAVLIYKLPPDDYHRPCVDLSKDRNKWESVIKYYRSGKKFSISDCLRAELREAKYMIGQINTQRIPKNPRRFENWKTWTPVASNEITQLCIRSEEMTNSVRYKLENTIYINP